MKFEETDINAKIIPESSFVSLLKDKFIRDLKFEFSENSGNIFYDVKFESTGGSNTAIVLEELSRFKFAGT